MLNLKLLNTFGFLFIGRYRDMNTPSVEAKSIGAHNVLSGGLEL